MKKTLNFLLVLMFIIIFAYLLSPDKKYTDKLWVHKGVILAQPYRAAVIEYVKKTSSLPRPGDLEYEKIQVRVNTGNTAIKTITVGEEGPGTVTIHYFTTGIESAPPQINNGTVTFIPQFADNKLSWSCNSTLPEEFIPTGCK